MIMKVLVACEYSGIVRDAFLAEGHDAISCDLLPTESLGPHIEGDVRPLLREPWDLVVAHPPCSYLSNFQCAFKNWEKLGHEDYWKQVERGIDFFLACLSANAPRVCVENPRPAPWAKAKIGKPSDYVQPFQFGEPYRKLTGLWLKGLPPLMRGCTITNPVNWVGENQSRSVLLNGTRKADFGFARTAKDRARFWPGIARAMAQQWGTLSPVGP